MIRLYELMTEMYKDDIPKGPEGYESFGKALYSFIKTGYRPVKIDESKQDYQEEDLQWVSSQRKQDYIREHEMDNGNTATHITDPLLRLGAVRDLMDMDGKYDDRYEALSEDQQEEFDDLLCRADRILKENGKEGISSK